VQAEEVEYSSITLQEKRRRGQEQSLSTDATMLLEMIAAANY
jgi:hypothetical protein